ncbi:hypothetical protein [Cupriavidus sp. TMH.W2]|uniref:hypothetical protein n=1 Tax=Cupriavidus sp. TMH.W2 TaxID=3434465 RepID=UPI003D76BBB4
MATNTIPHSETMRQALALWRQTTGLHAEQKSFRLGDWELRKTFELLDEAIALDPTEVTAMLLFDYFVDDYLRTTAVSMRELIDAPEVVQARLNAPRELLGMLHSPELLAVRAGFKAALQRAVDQYNAGEREDVQKLFAAPHDLALLRRDALRSMANLRVDQFLDGEPEPLNIRPVYHRTVHQWWNINSLLAAATRMPSGVSLNLIRDPDAFQSYFCFVIRNGGNLFVLTDKEALEHPLQAGMTRRPDRVLAERAARNWFPYELLNLEYDEASRRLYMTETKVRSLVAYQPAALPLKTVSELEPTDLVWTAMMFDLIVERFWRQGFKAPALSYTGEMLNADRDRALSNLATSSELPVATYDPLSLPPLRLEDVRTAAVSEDAVGYMQENPNQWMEERYADRISDASLNLLAAPGQTFLLQHDTGDLQQIDGKPKPIASFEKARATEIKNVDATAFGTRESLAQDRLFIARFNFAKQIDVHAQAEYDERKDEVRNWFRGRVTGNLAQLTHWAMHEIIWVADGIQDSWTRFTNTPANVRCQPVDRNKMSGPEHLFHSFLHRVDLTQHDNRQRLGGMHLGDWRGSAPICTLHCTRASYYVVYTPTNPAELAALAGCAIEDLPDGLQHWDLLEMSSGNHLLRRIDPLSWAMHNPWRQLDLSVRLAFSKRAMAQIEKREPVWPDIPNLLHDNPWPKHDSDAA